MAFPWYLVKSVEDGKISITTEGNIKPSSGSKPEEINVSLPKTDKKGEKPKTVRRSLPFGNIRRN